MMALSPHHRTVLTLTVAPAPSAREGSLPARPLPHQREQPEAVGEHQLCDVATLLPPGDHRQRHPGLLPGGLPVLAPQLSYHRLRAITATGALEVFAFLD